MTHRTSPVHPWIAQPFIVSLTLLLAAAVRAQDEAGPPPMPDTTVPQADRYDNLYQGQFTPGPGFDIIRTETRHAEHQLLRAVPVPEPDCPASRRTPIIWVGSAPVKARNDLNWHRTMVWLTGFFYDPKFRYNITLLVAGVDGADAAVRQSPLPDVGADDASASASGPNLTNRSLQGSWPFWAGSDRQMGEEFLRGGFSSAFWITGKPIGRFYYTASVNRSISQLGNTAADDNSRHGLQRERLVAAHDRRVRPARRIRRPRAPRAAGDAVRHVRVHQPRGSLRADRQPPKAIADPPVRRRASRSRPARSPNRSRSSKLTYRAMSFDAGAKYKGFSFQGEYTYRELSDFDATGPLPLSSIIDHGFFVEAMHMVVPEEARHLRRRRRTSSTSSSAIRGRSAAAPASIPTGRATGD